jgi:hypothetical protein
MKFRSIAVVLLAALLNLTAAEYIPKKAASALEGTWKWNFAMPDGSEAAPRLKFKTTKEGQLTGTSQFRNGTEKSITNLVFKNGQISFDVVRDYLGDKVLTHYSGRVQGDVIKGKITSHANGEEHTYDWEANRSSGIDGAWKWSVVFGRGRPVEFTLTLKQQADKVTGKVKSGFGETEIRGGQIKDGEIAFETERTNREGIVRLTKYYGKVANEKITGKTEANMGGEWFTNKWEPTRSD